MLIYYITFPMILLRFSTGEVIFVLGERTTYLLVCYNYNMLRNIFVSGTVLAAMLGLTGCAPGAALKYAQPTTEISSPADCVERETIINNNFSGKVLVRTGGTLTDMALFPFLKFAGALNPSYVQNFSNYSTYYRDQLCVLLRHHVARQGLESSSPHASSQSKWMEPKLLQRWNGGAWTSKILEGSHVEN